MEPMKKNSIEKFPISTFYADFLSDFWFEYKYSE